MLTVQITLTLLFPLNKQWIHSGYTSGAFAEYMWDTEIKNTKLYVNNLCVSLMTFCLAVYSCLLEHFNVQSPQLNVSR